MAAIFAFYSGKAVAHVPAIGIPVPDDIFARFSKRRIERGPSSTATVNYNLRFPDLDRV